MRFHGNVVKAINQPIKMVALGIVDPIASSTLQQLMGSFEIGIHPNYGHSIEKMVINVTGFWGTLFQTNPYEMSKLDTRWCPPSYKLVYNPI